jgi:hypothetical protein
MDHRATEPASAVIGHPAAEDAAPKNERQQSWQVANMWLDGRMNPLVQMVPGDPDCDACVLARSYLRALEKIERLTQIVMRLPPPPVYENRIMAEMADQWPKAIQ